MLDPFSSHLMSYKRILLKLSGQSLAGPNGSGIDMRSLVRVVSEIVPLTQLPVQLAIVVGGGNIWRWRDTKDSGIGRVESDTLGMLATVMNSVALCSELKAKGFEAHVLSALDVPGVTDPYEKGEAVAYLEQGHIVVCAGGTGHPYVTTDSAAAQRAVELDCDAVLKATHVDGVYDADPKDHAGAKKYDALSFDEALGKNLRIMDAAAFELCKNNGIPVVVFDVQNDGNIVKAASGDPIGTIVS